MLIALFIPILITCSYLILVEDHVKDETNSLPPKEAYAVEPETIGVLLKEASHAQHDFILALYRNSQTRKLVNDFFTKITNSAEISRVILDQADRYSVPPSLAFAVCCSESNFNHRAIGYNSSSKDLGLFQLNSLSFPDFSDEDFFSLERNAEAGIKYLHYCLERGGNAVVALALYNAGEGRVAFHGAPLSTLNYINSILSLRNSYEEEFRRFVFKN